MTDIAVTNIETNACLLRLPNCTIHSDGTIWCNSTPLLVVSHLPNANELKKKYAAAIKQKKFDEISDDHFGRLGTFGGILLVENADDYDNRLQVIEDRTIRVHLSTRGWGDYSAVEWTGDRNRPTTEIVAECQALLANGHDVDQPNQSNNEISAKVEVAKEKSLNQVAAQQSQTAHDEQIELERQEMINSGERMATPKQLAVIIKAREDWFDLFDGASGYGMYGPDNKELRLMTTEKASLLIGDIFDARKSP
jgi:hypothetical protein